MAKNANPTKPPPRALFQKTKYTGREDGKKGGSGRWGLQRRDMIEFLLSPERAAPVMISPNDKVFPAPLDSVGLRTGTCASPN